MSFPKSACIRDRFVGLLLREAVALLASTSGLVISSTHRFPSTFTRTTSRLFAGRLRNLEREGNKDQVSFADRNSKPTLSDVDTSVVVELSDVLCWFKHVHDKSGSGLRKEHEFAIYRTRGACRTAAAPHC
jgi:hypothetical protein